jgi:hypothetical protein
MGLCGEGIYEALKTFLRSNSVMRPEFGLEIVVEIVAEFGCFQKWDFVI